MKEIQLTRGKVTLVDDEDYEWLSRWKWYAHKDKYTYYAVRNSKYIKGKARNQLRMHREILNTPVGMDTDHRDMNGLNNQRYNIRICTKQQNYQNQKSYKGSSSNYKGVFYRKDNNKWRVILGLNGKLLHFGQYDSEIEAAKVYDKKCIELFGEFARPNFSQKAATSGTPKAQQGV